MSKSKISFLTKATVETLAGIKAQRKALEKQEADLVEQIKTEMDKKKIKEFLPDDCPFKLVLKKYQKRSVSWKEEWKSLAKEFFGLKKWKKKLKQLESANMVDASSLDVEANEKYKL